MGGRVGQDNKPLTVNNMGLALNRLAVREVQKVLVDLEIITKLLAPVKQLAQEASQGRGRDFKVNRGPGLGRAVADGADLGKLNDILGQAQPFFPASFITQPVPVAPDA